MVGISVCVTRSASRVPSLWASRMPLKKVVGDTCR
jgi:hypothetical protein